MTNTKDKRFSHGIGNRKAVGLHLDVEVIEYYKAIAQKLGLPYQSVINLALRQMMKENFNLVIKVNEDK